MKCIKYLAVCIYLLNAALVFAFENPLDIDSLKAITSEQKRRTGSDLNMANLYLSLSDAYERHEYYDSAMIYCQSALKWVGHDSVFYRIHARLGFLHYRLGDLGLGLRHCLLAEEKSIPHMDHKVRSRNLYNIAHLYASMGKYESALEGFYRALNDCAEADDSIGIANVYRGLALLHWKTENYQEALQYSKTVYPSVPKA